ncbi:MAG: VWA domain-containing protein [Desulfobacteraceae bacterium]|nr:VWA domain-containing protein [Desulfobacteraceae bacterium]
MMFHWKRNSAYLLALFTLWGLCCASISFATESNNGASMIIILDASGSMWGQIDGKSKMVIAKDALSGIVKNLPENMDVGFVAYGHRKKGDCNDVEQLIPLGEMNKSLLLEKINGLKPKGMTPISLSIKSTLSTLKDKENHATVILVSDGLETCNADPCETTRLLKESGIDFILHVIGFDVSEKENKQLHCIADAGNGKYFPAKNANQLRLAMGVITKPVVEKAVVAMDRTGTLFVDAARDFIKYTVYDKDDKSVAEGDTRISSIPLPAGKYTVKAVLAGKTLSTSGVVKDKETTTVFLGGTGTLFVRAVKDFIKYEVVDKAGNVAAKGDTRISILDLLEGEYTVRTKVSGKICTSSVVIESGKHTDTNLDCFGSLFVEAPKDFIRYHVIDEQGNKVAEGDTRISTLILASGNYTVTGKFAGMEFEEPVVITGMKHTTLKLEGAGTLFVRAAADFVKYQVVDKKGKQITAGDTNISTLDVPQGDYDVIVTVAGKTCKTPVSIKSGSRNNINLKCFSTLWVEANKDFLKFIVKDKAGNDIVGGDSRITKAIIPVGEYTVHCDGIEKTLKIEGGNRKTLNFKHLKQLPKPDDISQNHILDAKSKFLLSSSNDKVSEPLIIDLEKMKLFPGDTILIKILGKYQFDLNRPSEFMNDTIAVFSASNVILKQAKRHRVPGAIDCCIDIITDVTWFEKLVTDIAEDFDARDVQVVIPENAKFLFIGGTDGYVTDNKADSSYRVEIIKK